MTRKWLSVRLSFLFPIVSTELHLFCSHIVWRWMEFVGVVAQVCCLACALCELGSERKPFVRALFYVTAARFGVWYSQCHCDIKLYSVTDKYCQRSRSSGALIILYYIWRLGCVWIWSGTGSLMGNRGSTVVKVLCYKSEGRWFDPTWCHWNFSLT